MQIDFLRPATLRQGTLEEGSVFTPRFDANGLVTAVVTDAGDGTLLMVGAHERRGSGDDARDRHRALLVALARQAVEEGRNVRQFPAGRRDAAPTATRTRSGCASMSRATMQPVTPAGVPVSTGRSTWSTDRPFLPMMEAKPLFDPAEDVSESSLNQIHAVHDTDSPFRYGDLLVLMYGTKGDS